MKFRKTDAEIIEAFEPWTLACAVGAENGTVGIPIGLEQWLSISRKNWMPSVKTSLGWTTEERIERVLRDFVRCNIQKNMNIVLREEEEKRSKSPSLVIAPGESMTVRVPVPDYHIWR